MFRLLHGGQGSLDKPSQLRMSIARSLLDTSDDDCLDSTTRKIRKMCETELKNISLSGGRFPKGSLLHGLLVIAAQRLKLDSGELESVNSQIKTTIEQGSTQMSLELLSSRINTRKTLTMAAGGNTKVHVVKPIAQRLAAASTLYQGMEQHICLDPDRWSPPPPVQISGAKPDTCEKLTHEQKWAVKYNSLLMKALRHHQQKNMDTVTLGFMFQFPTHESIYLVAELTGRTCQTHFLEPTSGRSGEGNICHDVVHGDDAQNNYVMRQKDWMFPDKFRFIPSVSVLASTYGDVDHAGKTGIDMFLVELRLHLDPSRDQQGRVYFKAGKTFFVARLWKRRPYTKKQPDDSGIGFGSHEPVGDYDMDDGDNDDLGEHDGNFIDHDDTTDPSRDDDSESEDEIDAIERELAGTFEDVTVDFEQELKDDELGSDLFELDSINAKFVAHAVERQIDKPFCESDQLNTDGDSQLDTDNNRSFEDVMGEEVLQEFLKSDINSSQKQHRARRTHEEPTPQYTADLKDTTIYDALSHWSKAFGKSLESLQLMASALEII